MQITLIAGIAVITVALPAVQDDLQIDRSGLGLITAAYGVSFGGLLMLGGQLADMYGSRRIFRLGAVIFGIGSVAAAVAPGFALLVLARFVQGIGAALTAPPALALLRASYADAGRRERATAAWGGVNAIGATAGMVLSGVVVTFAHWRWNFVLPALAAAIVAILSNRLLPAPPPRTTRLNVVSASLVTLGLSVLTHGLLEAGDHPWTAPGVYWPVAAGAIVLVGFVAREARLSEPMLPPAFLASRRRATGVVAIFTMAGGMAATMFLLSLHLQQESGYSPLLTSLAFLPYGAMQVVVSMRAGALVDRFGTGRTTVSGLGLVAVGIAMLSPIAADTPYLGLPLAGLLTFAVGSALTFSGGMSAAMSGQSDHQAGLASGVVNTAMETGATAGFAVLIWLGSPSLEVAAIFVVLGFIATFTLKKESVTHE